MVRLVTIFALLFAGAAHAQPAKAVCGTWATEDADAHIGIEPCGESVCGAITWLVEPTEDSGPPELDENNDNEVLRERPMLGLPLLWGFTRQEDDRWTDGRIYNPKDGHTYRARLELTAPDTLKVTGCWFLFCGSQIWTRVDGGESQTC